MPTRFVRRASALLLVRFRCLGFRFMFPGSAVCFCFGLLDASIRLFHLLDPVFLPVPFHISFPLSCPTANRRGAFRCSMRSISDAAILLHRSGVLMLPDRSSSTFDGDCWKFQWPSCSVMPNAVRCGCSTALTCCVHCSPCAE
jgi:hypothetical protein